MVDTKTLPPLVDPSALRQIADGVWIMSDRRVPLVPNVGIVVGTHSALVIDTGMGRANGQVVLDVARRLAGSRRLYLTITHFHPEHGYGAECLKGVARIVYNKSQGDELAAKGMAYLEMFKGMGPAIALVLADTSLVEADELYSGSEHEIDLGGTSVVLKSWGKAHTRGDQVVYLPRQRVLFTGDLAEEKTFPIFPWFPPHDVDIDADNWVRALEDCLSMKPDLVVPGHGEVGGREILSDVRAYILDVSARVAAASAKGMNEDAMIAVLEPPIRAAHPDWHFPEWIAFAIRYFAVGPKDEAKR